VAEKINWTLSAQVVGGPRISVSDALTVDAIDKIGVPVASAESKTVEIQPGDEGRVQFLLINLAATEQFGDGLTYKVNDTTTEVRVDGPQMFIGDGAVGLLQQPPNTLTFTNNLTQDVDVQILVGRKAVTTPGRRAPQPSPSNRND
jgi:hypothetical protein